MRGDYPAEPGRELHGRAHHVLALHAAPIVRKGAAVRGHGLQIGELLPALAAGYRPVGQYADERAAAYRLYLGVQVLKAVRHGVQVRHGADCGEAAPRGGKCAALHSLLIRKSRLSKMYMHIGETGKKETVIEFKNRNALAGGDITPQTGNHAAGDLHVGGDETAGNERPAAFDDERIHAVPPFKRAKSPQPRATFRCIIPECKMRVKDKKRQGHASIISKINANKDK